MLSLKTRYGVSFLLKLLQFCVLAYLAIAVLYTTRLLVSMLFFACLSSSSLYIIRDAEFVKSASHPFTIDPRLSASSGTSASADGNHISWPSSLDDSLSVTSVSEAALLSKAFTQSLHPTKIIPYYYRSSTNVDNDDITIITLVTSNRFKVLKQLVERYQGPISVAIHVPLPVDGVDTLPDNHPSIKVLKELHDLYYSSPYFATYVDVHLAYSPFSRSLRGHGDDDGQGEGGRQFNVWRNVARLFARTELVMMLDVDFAVCTDWRTEVANAIRKFDGQMLSGNPDALLDGASTWPSTLNETAKLEVFKRLREGTAALVVPVFEYVNHDDGTDQRTFPQDKETLLRLSLNAEPTIASFHASWAAGHNSTNYARYYSIPPGQNEIYPVTQYQSAYEPYAIMSKRVPWCDERFTGYGANKAACLFEMYLSGVSFFVMSDHFLIHQSHKYEEQARREERKYNRKLYNDFKEEACLRYLHRFYVAGTLNSSRAMNAREECKKVKNVEKIAPVLFDIEL